MGDRTAISWTDSTWNPVRGCSRVSEGCRHCYAERVAVRFSGPGQPYHGLAKITAPRDSLDRVGGRRNGWTGEVRLVAEHLADPLRWKKPRRIFVNSMSDLFHESLTNEQIAAVFGVMAAAPHHTFQILTKRAVRMREWFGWVQREAAAANGGVGMTPAIFCFTLLQRYVADRQRFSDADRKLVSRADVVAAALAAPWPLPWLWLGVSTENQAAADERIPDLLATPAAVRFLSCEPLLGAIQFKPFTVGAGTYCFDCGGAGVKIDEDGCCATCGADAAWFGVDWVIAGCESGPGARPCDVAWLRSLRDQCAAASVAYFLKQAPTNEVSHPCEVYVKMKPLPVTTGPGSKRKAGGVIELPYLDGVQHAAFPVSHE